MTLPLLQSKLYMPPVPTSRVARPHLVERLEEGLLAGNRMTLISAGAGSGKSTLLSEWLVLHPGQVAWLALDEADNQTGRFWSYVIAALQKVRPGIGQALLAALPSIPADNLDSFREFLTDLLNEWVTNPGGNETTPVLLVLEDFHLLSNLIIFESLSFFLTHLPADLHLVISTRSDPALPVARLRARGQLSEVRASDLQFSPDEAGQLLNQLMDLNLPDEEIRELEASTEGWIAGLRMAGLAVQSLRRRQENADIGAFIRSFSGSHRFILDYLAAEVLTELPSATQDFLLKTSILDRLTGPLCNSVSGQENSQLILESMERDNLFIVPLDGERRWYRYHHLLTDLLRARLQYAHLDWIPDLHKRAGGWLEEQGKAANDLSMINQAVQHNIKAQDFSAAAHLLERYWAFWGFRGELTPAIDAMKSLPAACFQDSPMLSAGMAWLLFLRGDLNEVMFYLELSTRQVRELQAKGITELQGDHRLAAAQAAALRAYLARLAHDSKTAVREAEYVLSLELNEDIVLNGLVHSLLANSYRDEGLLDKASLSYDLSIRMLLEGGNLIAVSNQVYYYVRLLLRLGQPQRAYELCQGISDTLRAKGLDSLPAAGTSYAAQAEAALELGYSEEAFALLQKAMQLVRRSGSLDAVKLVTISQAVFFYNRGDLPAARSVLADVQRMLSSRQAATPQEDLQAWLARLNLIDQQAWLANAPALIAKENRMFFREPQELAYLYCLLETGQAAQALEFLDKICPAAQAAGLLGYAVELLVLRALALAQLGEQDAALNQTQQAVNLATPLGLRLVFQSLGKPFADLLDRALQRKNWESPQARAFAASLLQSDAGSPVATPAVENSLVEQLTERELDVLRLLAEGRSNSEIAAELIVAVGTVKTHVHNIFGKLDAQNRVQALARARQLKLI